MRFAYQVLSVLLAASTVAVPQLDSTHRGAAAALCPGRLTARPQGGPQVQWTLAREDQYKPGEKPSGHAGLHVALASGKAVRQIELAVHFIPPGAHISPLEAEKAGKQHEDSKTFELNSSKNVKTIEGDLLLGPVFKITRVRLLTVQYADGSSWHGKPDSCSVEPSLYMPVEKNKR